MGTRALWLVAVCALAVGCGWVTTRTPDGWRVDFHAPARGGYESKIRVTYPRVPEHGTVSAVDPPEPPDATRTAMIRPTRAGSTASRSSWRAGSLYDIDPRGLLPKDK